jgi:hypothetical protein
VNPKIDPAVFEQLRQVRRARLEGLDGPGIAARTGLSVRRVKHLEQQYRDRPLVQFLTPGLCRQVREAYAVGRHPTRAALAIEFDLTLDQVDAIWSREFPYVERI